MGSSALYEEGPSTKRTFRSMYPPTKSNLQEDDLKKNLHKCLLGADEDTKKMNVEKVMAFIHNLNEQQLMDGADDDEVWMNEHIEIPMVISNSIQMTQAIKR